MKIISWPGGVCDGRRTKIRKGDKVIVLTGRDKGSNGEVIEVAPGPRPRAGAGRNLVKRQQKQTAAEKAGISPRRRRLHL